LLQEIDAFILANGMAETTFGLQVANDGKLVARLRGGKGITTRTVEKIRAYIRTNASPGGAPEALPGSPEVLERIAVALERLAPQAKAGDDLGDADAFVWHTDGMRLEAVNDVSRIDIFLLKGIDEQADRLLANTQRFANGLPANNALLWGARGTGKSSLVKAVHAKVQKKHPGLALVEIHREDLSSLPKLLSLLRRSDRRCLLFCDDLSFESSDASYKSLKAVLEGGIEGRPDNVIFYATSNRRHLMARDMIENERSTAINPSEAVEEKVSLSDRFGLWLGFHNCDQDTYLAIVDGYAKHFKLKSPKIDLEAEAIEWSMTRGSRSGRVAWQFIQDLAGRLGKPLD
jgi:predicted AAA+ superfamily ATPase